MLVDQLRHCVHAIIFFYQYVFKHTNSLIRVNVSILFFCGCVSVCFLEDTMLSPSVIICQSLPQPLPGPAVQLFGQHRNVPRDCHSAVTCSCFHGYLPDHDEAHASPGKIQIKWICICKFASVCIAAHTAFISLTSPATAQMNELLSLPIFFHLNSLM